MQKLIQLNPGPASGGKLNTEEIDALLSQGWTVNQTCAAADGAVLVFLDPPKTDAAG